MALSPISYSNTAAHENDSGQATGKFRCEFSQAVTERAAILGQVDPNDATLICTAATIEYEDDDPQLNLAIVTATYTNPPVIYTPNASFQIRYEGTAESFTIGGSPSTDMINKAGGYPKWEDGVSINATNLTTLPTKTVGIVRVCLSGIRTSWNLGKIAEYAGTVNNATWQGAAAETVLCPGTFTATPIQGGLMVDIDLLWKSLDIGGGVFAGWNHYWREAYTDTNNPPVAHAAEWKVVAPAQGQKVYTPKDFSGLLGLT